MAQCKKVNKVHEGLSNTLQHILHHVVDEKYILVTYSVFIVNYVCLCGWMLISKVQAFYLQSLQIAHDVLEFHKLFESFTSCSQLLWITYEFHEVYE